MVMHSRTNQKQVTYNWPQSCYVLKNKNKRNAYIWVWEIAKNSKMWEIHHVYMFDQYVPQISSRSGINGGIWSILIKCTVIKEFIHKRIFITIGEKPDRFGIKTD